MATWIRAREPCTCRQDKFPCPSTDGFHYFTLCESVNPLLRRGLLPGEEEVDRVEAVTELEALKAFRRRADPSHHQNLDWRIKAIEHQHDVPQL